MALLAAAVLLIGGRRLFGRLIDADPAIEKPSYLSRLSVAFWSTLLPTAAVTVFLVDHLLPLRLFQRAETRHRHDDDDAVHRARRRVLRAKAGQGGAVAKAAELALISVETKAARLLLWLVSATVVFTGIDVFLSSVYQVLGSPLTLTVVESLVATVLTGFRSS